MDPTRFDRLAVSLGAATTRRTALARLLAGALASLVPAATDAAKKRRKRKRRNRGGDGEPNEPDGPCFLGSPCIVGPGANLRGCDLSGSGALQCPGCILSGANLENSDLFGANLASAILSGACLVDASLEGAFIGGAVFDDAIFCRTTMPDGSINNSGCDNSTPCCLTPPGSPTCKEVATVCREDAECCDNLICRDNGDFCGSGDLLFCCAQARSPCESDCDCCFHLTCSLAGTCCQGAGEFGFCDSDEDCCEGLVCNGAQFCDTAR